jgi:hypothetical protein
MHCFTQIVPPPTARRAFSPSATFRPLRKISERQVVTFMDVQMFTKSIFSCEQQVSRWSAHKNQPVSDPYTHSLTGSSKPNKAPLG